MDFLDFAKERYSCRSLLCKKIDKELIDKIIEAGMVAPTAVNKQPYKIWIMNSPESKERIKEVTRFDFNADTFLVVGAKMDEAWIRKYDGKNFGEVDAAIVATHMMLEIQNLGLRTTWVGHFNAPLLKELCPKMADYELIAIFPIGYQAEDGVPSERHTDRKSYEEIVEVL